MKNASLILILIIPISVFSQWRYTEINDDFDGVYRYSQVVGKGYDRTYDDPELILRKYKNEISFDLYIDDAGYFTTNSKNNILIKFDNEDVFYLTEGLPSKDRSALFISSNIWKEKIGGEQISRIELLEKMMKGSKVSMRLKTDYKTYDISFSLSGSSKAINYVLPNIDDEIKEWSDFRLKQENERLIKEQKLNYAISHKDSVLKNFLIEKIDTTNSIYNDLLKHFTEITTNLKFSENNILDSVSLTNVFDIYSNLEFYNSIQLLLHYNNLTDINYIDYQDFLINYVDDKTFSFKLKSYYSDKIEIYLDSSFYFDRKSSFINYDGNQWFFKSNKGTLSLEYVSKKKDFKLESSRIKRKFTNKSFRKIDELVIPYQNGYEGIVYHFKKKNDHKFIFCVNLKLNYFLTFIFEPNPKFIKDLNFVKNNYFKFDYIDN